MTLQLCVAVVIMAAYALSGCGGAHPSAAVREACANAQDTQDAFRDVLITRPKADTAASALQTATMERQQAALDDVRRAAGAPASGSLDLTTANARLAAADSEARQANAELLRNQKRLDDSIAALAHAANVSGNSTLSAEASQLTSSMTHIVGIALVCDFQDVNVRIDPEVSRATASNAPPAPPTSR